MTVANTKALDLLGKEISFFRILNDEMKVFFPDGIFVSGLVEAVVVHLSGHHEILVCDNFYSLNEVEIK